MVFIQEKRDKSLYLVNLAPNTITNKMNKTKTIAYEELVPGV